MTDFLGNELNIGDEVVFIRKSGACAVSLSRGKITRLTDTTACIEVDYQTEYGISARCTGQNIFKLNFQQPTI